MAHTMFHVGQATSQTDVVVYGARAIEGIDVWELFEDPLREAQNKFSVMFTRMSVHVVGINLSLENVNKDVRGSLGQVSKV